MTFGDMIVQLVQLSTIGSQFKVVDAMDVSICKIWADVNLELHLSKDFKKTIASGLMFLGEDYNWGDPHPQKMKERFSGDFGCASCEGEVDEAIIRKALVSVSKGEV